MNEMNVKKSEVKKPYIQTFGYFNIFLDEEPVIFTNAMEKEIMACLVEHDGGSVSDREIMNCIFDGAFIDNSKQVTFRKAKKGLIQTCEHYGIGHILLCRNKTMSVLRKEVHCDFFAFNDGDAYYINNYGGQFMREYSWAETAQASMDRRQERYFLQHPDRFSEV